jgi:hypothetical protein
MKSCRVCHESLGESMFVMRGSKITNTCIECSNKRKQYDYCHHNTRYHDCPECTDPLVRRATAIIHSSRISDKKKNRICDIDFRWAINQITQNPKCNYCDIELQYLAPYLPNHATIDRKNDTLGHTKDNCVIACRGCNCYQNKYKYFLKL